MDGDLDIDFLHEIASRMSLAPPLHEVLREVMRFAAAVVQCDSCFVYVLEKTSWCCGPRRIRIPRSSTG